MSIDKRKLGSTSKWYRCKSCGVREELIAPEDEIRKSEEEQIKILKQKMRDERGLYDGEGHNTY